MSPRVVLIALIVVGAAAPVRAQPGPNDIDIQNFRPAMDSKGLVTVERSKALGTLEPSLGLFLNYAFAPLSQQIGAEDGPIVDSFGTANFTAAIGFAHIFEIGANLPIVIVRGDADGPGDGTELAGDGLGDAELSAKLRILDRETSYVGVAFVPSVRFDTGEPGIFASHAQATVFVPRLVVDWDIGDRVSMAVNGGARLREKREIAGTVNRTDPETEMVEVLVREDPIVTGSEVTYAAGVGVTVIAERLDLIVEAYGAAPLESEAERATPLEVLAALKLYLVGNSFFTAGATRGLLDSYGDPDVRIFAGIVFEPAVGDKDGDGLLDDIDECPSRAEDKDGFEDDDGCPEDDNDGDGIYDEVDLCPNVPEDFNEYEDKDGCPDGDRDRDRDGILDNEDQCPDEAEDVDNFADGDGCPEPDNDNDGLIDLIDQCPNTPEDVDGFQDDDGCPDPDNDEDGIADVVDRCPDIAENINGVEDDDGCPEAPKKVVISGGKINILDKVYFETNKTTIKPESYEILFQVAETLRQNAQITKIEIQGHTDSRGRDKYNLRLSQGRADSVASFLVEQGGIDRRRLTSRGYGEEAPLDAAETAQAWAKNRRVEFVILEEDGKPVEKDPYDDPF